jgi:hypothetical protein
VTCPQNLAASGVVSLGGQARAYVKDFVLSKQIDLTIPPNVLARADRVIK